MAMRTRLQLNTAEEEKLNLKGLKPGLPVRIIGPPYCGAIGHASALPVELQFIETKSDVKLLEVEI